MTESTTPGRPPAGAAAHGRHDPDLSQAYAELARIVVGHEPVGLVLERVARLATAHVPGVDEVSITLVEDERARTAAFTGQAAAALDERQYEVGFGPCMDAARSGRTVRITSTDAEPSTQYAEFTVLARRAGVTSSVSVPMPVPHGVVGALNLYTFGGRPLDDAEVGVAEVFAGYGGVALANAALYDSATRLVGQLQTAMVSRAVIDQAKGILVATTGCTPEHAFTVLAQRSQKENRKLREVAEELVAGAQQGAPPEARESPADGPRPAAP